MMLLDLISKAVNEQMLIRRTIALTIVAQCPFASYGIIRLLFTQPEIITSPIVALYTASCGGAVAAAWVYNKTREEVK